MSRAPSAATQCGKNFSLALSESGDVYSWGAGSALQLGHGGKAGEEYPRMVEALRDVRKIAAGANAEHAAALVGEAAEHDGADEEEEADEVKLAEEQLEKARNRREDALRAMTADVEALELQVNKLDAKLSSMQDETMIAAMHALRENIKAEVGELEILISGKQQLEESMTLLNKHKTNQFRTNMLMKWSRPGAGGGGGEGDGGAGGAAGGGFTPRTLGKKQEELRTMQGEKKTLMSELKDCDDQLEQVRARRHPAATPPPPRRHPAATPPPPRRQPAASPPPLLLHRRCTHPAAIWPPHPRRTPAAPSPFGCARAQIELEKARLQEAADEDPDIAEALEELREQLNESKREKLEELQQLEQAQRPRPTSPKLARPRPTSPGLARPRPASPRPRPDLARPHPDLPCRPSAASPPSWASRSPSPRPAAARPSRAAWPAAAAAAARATWTRARRCSSSRRRRCGSGSSRAASRRSTWGSRRRSASRT